MDALRAPMNALHAGTPLDGQGFTIVPIEEVRIGNYAVAGGGMWTLGFKAPVAVVVCGPSGIRAVGVQGEDVDLKELASRVSGLNALLDACRS